MRTLRVLTLIFPLLLVSHFASAAEVDIYIATSGNDANPGTATQPVQTFQRVQALVRNALAVQNFSDDIHVYINDGVYFFSSPLTMTGADGGNDKIRIYYQAVAGASPRLVGGLVTPGSNLNWQLYNSSNNVWVASIDPYVYFPAKDRFGNAVSNPVFRDLYVNGAPAIRARIPKLVSGRPDLSYFDTAYWTINTQTSPSGAFPGIPQNVQGVDVGAAITKTYLTPSSSADCSNTSTTHPIEVVAQQAWMQSYLRIGSYATGGTNISAYVCAPEYSDVLNNAPFIDPVTHQPSLYNNAPFHLENSLDFLSAENEWFYDSKNKLLYYKPIGSANPNQLEIMIPTFETILIVQGTSSQPVKNMSFVGLTFENTTFYEPNSRGYAAYQASVYANGNGHDQGYQPAAVTVSNATGIKFQNDEFRNLGAEGLQFDGNTYDDMISLNRFHDIGGSCLSIGDTLSSSPHDSSDSDSIVNNTIWSCGERFGGSVGIFAKVVSNALITNNYLRYLPYAGISVGWGWSSSTGMTLNNISNNSVYNFSQLLYDGGGIYTLSDQTGSIMQGNHIGNFTQPPPYAGSAQPTQSAGIYMDTGTTGYSVLNNLMRQVATFPCGTRNTSIHQHSNGINTLGSNNYIDNSQQNWIDIEHETWIVDSSWQLVANPWVDPPSC